MAKIVSKSPADAGKTIHVRGAREHNLKNVDLEIPRDALIVFTGLSGSGKSSLAFDTIYAEGQRRYVESLSAYARQFLEMMQKPDVDHIDGLSPAISIEQKTTSQQPALHRRHGHRDLRLPAPAVRARGRALFAGHRPADREPDRHADGGPGAGAAGGHAPLPAGADRARAQGRVPQGAGRAAEEGLPARQDQRPVLPRSPRRRSSTRSTSTTSTWWWTASSCRKDIAARLADSFETALELADGIAIAEYADKPLGASDPPRAGRWRSREAGDRRRSLDGRAWRRRPGGADTDRRSATCARRNKNETHERITFSARFACPVSGFTIDEIEPGCSRSTRRPAPARSATGSARRCASRPTWWCPTRR